MFILFQSSSHPISADINSTRCTSSTPIACATVSCRVVTRITPVAAACNGVLSKLVQTAGCQTSSNTMKKLLSVMATASLLLSSPTVSSCSWGTPKFRRTSFKRDISEYS
uniref:Uncharacterized protein n=1 Tax=Triticum urartu TaxID=4572 RepID=A0A8R7VB83_TRIUA